MIQYAPPLHFAVREGHEDLVKYLVANGGLDPTYRTYPFLDTLATVAEGLARKRVPRSHRRRFRDPF